MSEINLNHEWPRKNFSYNINTVSTKQVLGIKKNVNLGIISESNTKFAKLTL